MHRAGGIHSLAIETLGIKREDHIVVYDSLGIKTSARLWWMLKVFGHERVSVLDGGLKKWRLEDRPLTATITESAQNLCSEVIINSDLVIELSELLDDVLGPIYAQKYRLLDARNYRE